MFIQALLSTTPNAPPYPEGDRKGPIPTSTLPSPLQRRREANESHHIFVRAAVAERRVGTLAVARAVGYDPSMDELMSSDDPPRATIKAHPTTHHPPSPLRILMGFSSFDAYYYSNPASRARMIA